MSRQSSSSALGHSPLKDPLSYTKATPFLHDDWGTQANRAGIKESEVDEEYRTQSRMAKGHSSMLILQMFTTELSAADEHGRAKRSYDIEIRLDRKSLYKKSWEGRAVGKAAGTNTSLYW
jgi:hypothetical protein